MLRKTVLTMLCVFLNKDAYNCTILFQDIGCGVGGPARTIAKFSGASVTGLNICEYQLKRARAHTEKADLQDLVTFVKVSIASVQYILFLHLLCINTL